MDTTTRPAFSLGTPEDRVIQAAAQPIVEATFGALIDLLEGLTPHRLRDDRMTGVECEEDVLLLLRAVIDTAAARWTDGALLDLMASTGGYRDWRKRADLYPTMVAPATEDDERAPS
jgi:hypothetical protein